MVIKNAIHTVLNKSSCKESDHLQHYKIQIKVNLKSDNKKHVLLNKKQFAKFGATPFKSLIMCF